MEDREAVLEITARISAGNLPAIMDRRSQRGNKRKSASVRSKRADRDPAFGRFAIPSEADGPGVFMSRAAW